VEETKVPGENHRPAASHFHKDYSKYFYHKFAQIGGVRVCKVFYVLKQENYNVYWYVLKQENYNVYWYVLKQENYNVYWYVLKQENYNVIVKRSVQKVQFKCVYLAGGEILDPAFCDRLILSPILKAIP
jgi:hypothetical protein